MATVRTKNTLWIDGNWGELNVDCQFTSVSDRSPASFIVRLDDDGPRLMFSELKEILAFAESEFERLAAEEPRP